MAGKRQSEPITSPEISSSYDPFESPRPDAIGPISPHTWSQQWSRSIRGKDGETIYSPISPQPSINRGVGFSPYSETTGSETLYGPGVPQRKPVKSSMSMQSISTTNTRMSRHDPDTQDLLDRRSTQTAEWGIHWFTPFAMVSLFILGVLGACSHHIFYQSLQGKEANTAKQLEKIRYGTALAFFTKATLVGSVVLAYRQRIWYTLRRKALSISTIDGLFACVEDPTEFRKWGMIKNAKLATFMAICTWLIPLAAVLSPASLTSDANTITNTTECQVPTLDFLGEGPVNFRAPKIIDGHPAASFCYWNTTDLNGNKTGYFDYFDQPSKNAQRLSILNAYRGKPEERNGAAALACGAGWNCTYDVSFTGPGYKCEILADGIDANTTYLAGAGVPFNTSQLVPMGDNIYKAEVDIGEYKFPQVASQKGVPVEGPPYPDWLGVLKTEPVLYIGHTIDTYQPLPKNAPYSGKWETVLKPQIFKCEHYETQYTFRFNYIENVQFTERLNRTFVKPVIDTYVMQFDNGTLNPNDIRPTTGWVRPTADVDRYRTVASYHSSSLILRDFLRGSVEHTHKSWPVTYSTITETRLVNQSNWYAYPDLMDRLQDFYEDMLITTFSDPYLLVAEYVTVPCNKTRLQISFNYRARDLWAGYSVVIFLTLVYLGIGFWAMLSNGVASDTLFSRIMVTTRNPTLDRLSVGACLGGDPFPLELRRAKLRFGVLDETIEGASTPGRIDDGEGWSGNEKIEHCAFGTSQQTSDIRKGGKYA